MLGIKDLVCQNEAFIIKLCWGLLVQRDSPWVQGLRAKYWLDDNTILRVSARRSQSAVRSAISKVWDKFRKGVGFKLGDGKSINVWWDLLMHFDQPLMNYVVANHANINPEERVSDFILSNGEWNVGRLRNFLRP